jgi:hydroxyacyl-ACP dehydratase HTD2-like protein with hotdog domain
MSTTTVFTPEAQAWIGRSQTFAAYAVTAVDIAKYCHVMGFTDPVSLDVHAARAAGHPDLLAPVGYHMVIRHAVPNVLPLEELAADGGSPDMTPPSTTSRRMAGATHIELRGAIHVGDEITLTKSIAAVEEKVGRSGPLGFVTYALDFRNQHGETVVHETYVRILR